MNFKTHNDYALTALGTSLQGHINCSYKRLVEVFGEPYKGSYKTDAEWIIHFENDFIATIYNYKDGKNYCGKDGLEKSQITDWHIGGDSTESFDLIESILFHEED